MGEYIYYSYCVKEKKGHGLRIARVLTYYIIVAAAYFLGISVMFSTNSALDILFYPFLIALPFIMALIVWFTWRFTSLEYEYEFDVDTFTVAFVFGKRNRFVKLSVPVDSFMEIAPFDDMTEAHLDELGCEKTLFYTSDPNSPNLCYAIFRIKDNRLAVLYMDMDSKMAHILRRANPGASKHIIAFYKENENEKTT